MEAKILYWMVRGEDRKPIINEDVRAVLEADGWTVDGENEAAPVRRGRKPKAESEE